VQLELAQLFSSCVAFEFSLNRVVRLGDALVLCPAPAEPFIELTNKVAECFPEFPSYGGKFKNIIPHLTVARGAEAELAGVQRTLMGMLDERGTVRSRCQRITMIENSSGLWHHLQSFQLT
jgi:hypothetical protein